MFTSYLQMFIFVFILILCINNGHVTANGQTSFDKNDDESFYLKNSMPENLQLIKRGVWSRLFRSKTNSPQTTDSRSDQFPAPLAFAAAKIRLQLLPYEKRTIPLELRKALYAHGIVGRRR
jgi:hypothetical protein